MKELKYNSINEIISSPEWKEFIDLENKAEEERIANEIDAQFLPESGHLLHGVINNVGVVIKDNSVAVESCIIKLEGCIDIVPSLLSTMLLTNK